MFPSILISLLLFQVFSLLYDSRRPVQIGGSSTENQRCPSVIKGEQVVVEAAYMMIDWDGRYAVILCPAAHQERT